MPIPAALAARLAKRGIVQKKVIKVPEEAKPAAVTPADTDEVEEVFAEDYDEPDIATPQIEAQHEHPPEQTILDEEEEQLVYETSACPNRVNKYHTCSEYCKERWGYREFQSDPISDHKRLHMLKKHPLPEGWEEVGDPETGRYYYWNMSTDEVSWLPPTHPRTQVTLSAERLKTLLEGSQESDHRSEDDEDEGDIMDIDDFEEIERKILMEKSVKEKEKKREKKRREEPLDPMDPAAYSDIPRGGWASGLEQKGSAKTGVDSTASGPLYQQRPYPSPGAILRMNKNLD